jgi:hypothetical protein
MSNWQCINCGRSQGFKWSGNGCKANGGGLHIVREVQRAPKFSSFRGYRGDSGSIIILFFAQNLTKNNLGNEPYVLPRNF